ncbi:MAG: helix-turn-helix transcriptional regulator [Thermodesulfobacteriota bacterium]|nr:helix-turn-helix transcriptional regulator [Thermodesulfobacteriota bacterium]
MCIFFDNNIFINNIKEILDRHQITQKDFTKRIGKKGDIVSRIKRNEFKPGLDTIARISREFNISISELLTGEGEMKKNLTTYENKEDNANWVGETKPGYYKGVMEKIILILEKMTEDQKKDILKYLEKKQLLDELLEERRAKKEC